MQSHRRHKTDIILKYTEVPTNRIANNKLTQLEVFNYIGSPKLRPSKGIDILNSRCFPSLHYILGRKGGRRHSFALVFSLLLVMKSPLSVVGTRQPPGRWHCAPLKFVLHFFVPWRSPKNNHCASVHQSPRWCCGIVVGELGEEIKKKKISHKNRAEKLLW